MKIRHIITITLLFFTLAACGSSEDSMPADPKIKTTESKPEVAETANLDKSNEMAKIAYAMGANSGVFLAKNLPEFKNWGMDLDAELIKTGFIDSLDQKSQMSEEEIQTVLLAFQETIKTKLAEIAEQQAEAASETNKLFLDTNAAKEGVKTTESGIQYRIITEGEGKNPAPTDTVKVNYKGSLISGEEFDSSYKRGEPTEFALNGVIPGWTEGLQLIKEGGKIELVLPPELAYGTRKLPSIPANSVLVFEVELLEIKQAEEAMVDK